MLTNRMVLLAALCFLAEGESGCATTYQYFSDQRQNVRPHRRLRRILRTYSRPTLGIEATQTFEERAERAVRFIGSVTGPWSSDPDSPNSPHRYITEYLVPELDDFMPYFLQEGYELEIYQNRLHNERVSLEEAGIDGKTHAQLVEKYHAAGKLRNLRDLYEELGDGREDPQNLERRIAEIFDIRLNP